MFNDVNNDHREERVFLIILGLVASTLWKADHEPGILIG